MNFSVNLLAVALVRDKFLLTLILGFFIDKRRRTVTFQKRKTLLIILDYTVTTLGQVALTALIYFFLPSFDFYFFDLFIDLLRRLQKFTFLGLLVWMQQNLIVFFFCMTLFAKDFKQIHTILRRKRFHDVLVLQTLSIWKVFRSALYSDLLQRVLRLISKNLYFKWRLIY